MFALIINNDIYSAFIMIIINLIIDKSIYNLQIYKLQQNIDNTYCILDYTRIKPRSRPPQKKSAYFTHADFSTAKIGKKKNAQITRANTVVYMFHNFG